MAEDLPRRTFAVDTNIFRELGEYLVGRNSTALVELIKNSYDADATNVIVHGEALGTPEGFIRVIDDGTGMSPVQFAQGFLTIAGRTKRDAERTSSRYRRRFTGAKGVGRLAAHKLARHLEVRSVPSGEGFRTGIEAAVDWDLIEKRSTLNDLDDDTPRVSTFPVDAATESGTAITLTRLRQVWTTRTRSDFLRELNTFLPPSVLKDEMGSPLLDSKLLFLMPEVRDADSDDPGFQVELSGDFDAGEELWPDLANLTWWVIEIDARPDGVDYGIAPTDRALDSKYPDAERREFKVSHPDPDAGPFFQARVLVREGQAPRTHATAIKAMSGIRVYMEGFRVLPYGEPRDDWLGITADYAGRSTSPLELLERVPDADEPQEKEGLVVLPQTAYVGGVFLTDRRSGGLQMVVNREGFVPGPATAHLTDLVRTGVDLSTRVRARYSVERRQKRRVEREKAAARRVEEQEPDGTATPERKGAAGPRTLDQLTKSVGELREAISKATSEASSGNLEAVAASLQEALPALEMVEDVQEDMVSEEALTRVLASVGTQMSAFIHDLSGLVSAARDAHALVESVRKDSSLTREQRSTLAPLDRSLHELQHALERQAAYLTDVISAEARKRRSRQRIHDRFESAARLVMTSAQRRGIEITNKIPEGLRTPPMFPAELTTVFANLLTNAIKAAGDGGAVRATGAKREGGTVVVHVDNTGDAVNLDNSERLFAAFESTTTSIDPVLGQGMGLGLPITRSILDEYRAEVRFAEPPAGFSTRVTVTFPKR